MKKEEPTAALTFEWTPREIGSWWLAALIFLSFLLHSAAFFIFQGKTPIAARPPGTAPSVQLLTAFAPDGSRSLENEALLQWIATQDPALIAKNASVEPKGLLDVRYKPSFETMRTVPLGVPDERTTNEFPPAREPLALMRSAMPRAAAQPVAPAPEPTRVAISETLAPRSPAEVRMIPKSKVNTTVEPTTVLAGVSEKGEVRFAMLNRQCGDSQLDAEATNFVRTIRFAPSEQALQWGTITFHWGDDAFAGTDAPR